MSPAKTVPAAVQSAVSALLGELHAKACCETVGLIREDFAAVLCDVAVKYLPAAAGESEVQSFLVTLRVE